MCEDDGTFKRPPSKERLVRASFLDKQYIPENIEKISCEGCVGGWVFGWSVESEGGFAYGRMGGLDTKWLQDKKEIGCKRIYSLNSLMYMYITHTV